MSEPQIEQRSAQPYLRIAGRIESDVSAFVDSAFKELFEWLAGRGIESSGPEFILFRELDSDGRPVEVEIGVPVTAEAEGDDRVESDVLPGGRYLTYLHNGAYHPETGPDLSDSLAQLTDWAAQNGIEHSDWFLEHYLIGPETELDEANWLTEFAFLVMGAS